jgi:acetyl-CoA C-acetyltransferase
MIFDAVRTPRGKGRASSGALAELSPVELAAIPLRALVERAGLDPARIDDVILGCVDPVRDQGGDIARTAALAAGYGESVPGVVVSRFCASGLEACAIATGKVASGETDLVVAGGIEMMSRVPMLSSGMGVLSDPGLATPMLTVPQGVSADLLATLCGHSREDVDAYALESHRRAATAWAEGRFGGSIVPVHDRAGLAILDTDETVRPDVRPEDMAALPPAFEAYARRTGFDQVASQRHPGIGEIAYVHTAANSSQIADGAAALLMGSAEAGTQSGLRPRARVRAVASVGSEPTIMLTGPALAVKKALSKAGLTVDDVEVWELNEAFATVVLYFMQTLGVPADRINVNGGAIAMGHPLGATGAMILGTLIDELERSDRTIGVATLCAATGQAIAMVVERV